MGVKIRKLKGGQTAFYGEFHYGGKAIHVEPLEAKTREQAVRMFDRRLATVVQEYQTAQALKENEANNVTFGALCDKFFEGYDKTSARDKKIYAAFWREQIGETTLVQSITSAIIDDAVTALKKKKVPHGKKLSDKTISPSTQKIYVVFLKTLLKYGRENRDLKIQQIKWPTLEKIVKREKHAYTLAQLLTQRDALPDFMQPIFEFSVQSGLRKMNTLLLKKSQVHWHGERDSYISVIGKGDKENRVPVTPAIYRILCHVWNDHPEYVFSFPAQRNQVFNGKKRGRIEYRIGERYPVTAQVARTAFEKARITTGILKRWHDNRHAFGTYLQKSAGDMKIVQTLMHHSEVRTTEEYVHVHDSRIVDAVNGMGDLFQPSQNKGETSVPLLPPPSRSVQ